VKEVLRDEEEEGLKGTGGGSFPKGGGPLLIFESVFRALTRVDRTGQLSYTRIDRVEPLRDSGKREKAGAGSNTSRSPLAKC